jgi:PAS domain S-box-containing protein
MKDDRPLLVVGPADPAWRLATDLSAAGYRTVLTSTTAAVDPPDAVAGLVIAVGDDVRPGFDAVRAAAERIPETPVLAYALDGGEDVARDAVRAGADDYTADPEAVPERVAATVDAAGADVPRGTPSARDDRDLARMITEAPLAVVEWDLEFRVRRWNDAAADLFGYDADEARDRHASFLVPEDERVDVEAAWEMIVDTGRPVSGLNENCTADGDRVLCEWYNAPIRDDDGAVTRVVSLVRDATDRRQQERTLRTLHEATRELMSARDPEDIYRIAVHTARDVLEMPLATGFRYDDDAELLHPVENTRAATETFGEPPTFELGEGIAGDAFERGEVETFADATTDDRVDPQGPSARVRSYVVVPIGKYGLFTVADTAVGAFDDRDVELIKTLAANTEAALERARRERELKRQNERLDRFASVVGHDLRNPLTVARGNLDRLAAEADLDGAALDDVAAALDRMDAMLTDLLTLAQDGEVVGETRPLSVESVARDAWVTVEAEDASLTVANDVVVDGDESRVRQLLENLFRNSVEHGSTDDGDVHVTVGATDDGFYVADDGPGIPESERERLLESGASTEGGTGLGLAIVRRIAEGHGWSVDIGESEAGGARVVLRAS